MQFITALLAVNWFESNSVMVLVLPSELNTPTAIVLRSFSAPVSPGRGPVARVVVPTRLSSNLALFSFSVFGAGSVSAEQAERMIKNHGAERILFASDMPWDSPQNIKSLVERLDLSNEDRENILHKNAEKLLKIC